MAPGRHARRRRNVARGVAGIAGAAAVVAAVSLAMIAVGTGPPSDLASGGRRGSSGTAPPSASSATSTPTPTPQEDVRFRVRTTRLRFVDRSRSLPGTGSPRLLRTVVWYPQRIGTATEPAEPPAATSFPMVVFAHGFDLYPSAYGDLLRAWARAGYIVAAPVFPLTNPGAFGGADESDVIHQPGDVRFVISRLIALADRPSSELYGLVDRSRIAVAGHSDGGETAMALGYDSCCRDPRIRAVIVLAGAQLQVPGGRYASGKGPTLLAVQGTADTVNPPSRTLALYAAAPRPKFLLWLRGADHLAPFTELGKYGTIVRRMTVEFLDRYLKGGGTRPIRLPKDLRGTGLAVLRIDG